jgi:hypothetical protein
MTPIKTLSIDDVVAKMKLWLDAKKAARDQASIS